jgi:hypothetical protein
MTDFSLKRNLFSFLLLTFGLLFFSFFSNRGFAADSLDSNETIVNSIGTKASQTLTVDTVPSDNETITIGTCVVTFTTVSGSTSDELNCNDNVAQIDKNTGSGNDSRTNEDIANVLSTLTNVSDATLGTLVATNSANTVKFEDETSVSGDIIFSEISGKITSVSATGTPPVAQVVDFTPEEITAANTEYKITINSNDYSYLSTDSATIKTIVEDLQGKVNGDSAVTCTEDDTKITCTADVAGTLFTYSTSETPDALSPTFTSFVISGGLDNGGTLYAKKDDNINITLNTSSDTWKTGNNGVFSIGTTTGLNTGNFTQSTSNKTLANKSYTILDGQNGEFNFTGLTFLDQYDNSISGFSSPYSPTTNIVVDTTLPVVTFETDIDSTDPVQSQTVNIKVVDTNLDSYMYGLSSDATCTNTDTYDTSFTSETDIIFNTETDNTKYICVKALDKAGNISYLGSINPLNIDITAPVQPTLPADLKETSDLGNVNDDNITNDTTPVFTVKCTESDSTLTLYDSATQIGTHTCSAVGDAEITSSTLTAGSHSIVYTETDLAGNQSPSSSTLVVNIDTEKPTIVISDDEGGVANIDGGSVVFTVTFSEAVYDFTADDITVTGGTAGTFSGSDGDTTYTLEVTPTADSTADITVNIDADKVMDLAGNGNTVATEWTQEVDTVRPTVTITDNVTGSPDTTNIANPDVTFTFTISEASTDFTADDITVVNGTKGTFTTNSATEYTLVVTSDNDFEGNITVDILADSFTDPAGNSNTAPSQYIQAVDTKAPVLTSTTVSTSDTGNDVSGTQYAKLAEKVIYTIGYSENVTVSDITSSTGNNITTLTTEVSASSGNTDSLEFTVADTDTGEVTPKDIKYTITDEAGNPTEITSLGTVTGDTVMSDGIVPSITETSVSSDGNTVDTTDYLKEGKKVSYSITYSENITVSDITSSDFNNITTLTTEVSATDSSSDSLEFTVADTDNGEVTENTINFKIVDIAGNEISITSLGTITGNTIISDTTKPTGSDITIKSDNSEGEDPKTEKAKKDDIITLDFKSSETVVLPLVKVATKDATVTSTTNDHSAVYTVVEADTQGEVAIEISITDLAGNTVDPIITSTTDSSKVMIDTVLPSLTEVTAVSTPSNNTTPSYIFSTDENGVITYDGNCSSTIVNALSSGSNTITFNALSQGSHANCTITVTDATGNISNPLAINTFLIDTSSPNLILKGENDIKMDIGYNYIDEGVSCTDNATGCTVSTVSNLDSNTVGNYTVTYTGTDSAGNSSSIIRNLQVIETKTSESSNSRSGGGGGGSSSKSRRALLSTSTPIPTILPIETQNPTSEIEEELSENINLSEVCIEKSYKKEEIEVSEDLFSDVKKTDKRYGSLVFLAKKGIIKGDGDTGYARLKAPLNRAEFSKLLTISRGETNVLAGGKCERSNKFKDVDNNEWYAEFVYSMKNANIIHGYPDGSFQATNNINLVEIYKTLSIAFGYITYEEANELSNGKNIEWYVPYKKALIEAGVVPLRFGRYSADHIVKRQDVFEILYNIVKLRD